MHKKKVVGNSFIGFIYKILMMVIGFVSRKIFIVYLGEEILGLNSLYANLLDFLNLADLGIGIAVQYQLYGPLVKKDYNKQSKIISAAKTLYNKIGLFVFAAGIVLSFFIQILIKETTYPINFVRVSFLISVIGVGCGYFFVHKRLFLQADEELGLVNIIDLSAKVGTTVLSLILTIVFRNYFIYLIINALYGFTSNIIIHFIFIKKYPNVSARRKDNEIEKKSLTADLKNVVPLKFSDYIYKSTDNVIVSKVLGLVTVARYSNYMTIINGIMGMEFILGNVITASMGKAIKEKDDTCKIYEYYCVFQYAQFLFTNFCTISLVVLCTPFIKLWIGEEFIIENNVFILLIINFFIHSMYQPANVMYGAAGKFKDDKYITITSAVLNIVISISMVFILGLSGVIIGTIVTDVYILFIRSYQIVKKFFKANLLKYVLLFMRYTIITVAGIFLSVYLSQFITTNSLITELVLKGIICVLVPNILAIVGTFDIKEFKSVYKMVLGRARRRL